MHRLNDWLGHFRADRSKKAKKKNSSSKFRYSISAVQKRKVATDDDCNSWSLQEDDECPYRETEQLEQPLFKKVHIRTNPWISRDDVQATCAKVTNSKGDSACSSGYASQDCSPDSSVHLPNWPEDTGQKSPIEPSGNFNPIDILNTNNDCIKKRLQYKTPPVFHAPPPPPIIGENCYFLTELDAQIDDLRRKSEAVRHLIEQARKERERRLKDKQNCMERVLELTALKLVVRHEFELRL